MLIQHKIKQDEQGQIYVKKEFVLEVNLSSVKKPSDIVFFEYIGGTQ